MASAVPACWSQPRVLPRRTVLGGSTTLRASSSGGSWKRCKSPCAANKCIQVRASDKDGAQLRRSGESEGERKGGRGKEAAFTCPPPLSCSPALRTTRISDDSSFLLFLFDSLRSQKQ